MRPGLLLCAAALSAGCSRAELPGLAITAPTSGTEPKAQVLPSEGLGIRPIPPIPAALHGCWDAPEPGDPDEPGGAFRVIIDAASITQSAEGVGTRVATAEIVEEVTPTSIRGRFTAPDGKYRATVATSLILGPDETLGLPAGTLRLAEGDAGSAFLERCADRPRPERG